MKFQGSGFSWQAVALLALAGTAGIAHAQTAPPNDNWANAKVIPAVTPATPYNDTEANVNIATVETTDPLITCKAQVTPTGGGGVGINQQYRSLQGQMAQTVWYTYTTGASAEYVNIKAIENALNTTYFDPVIAVWTGTPQTGFRMVTGGCNDDGVAYSAANNWSHIAGLRLQPNTTYSIEIAFNPLLTGTFAMPAADVLRVNVAAATVINVDTQNDPVPVDFSVWTSAASNPCLTPTTPGTCSLRAAIETAQILGEADPTGVAAGASGANGAAILVPAGDYYLSPWATTPNDPSTTSTGIQNIGGGDLDLWGSMGIYGVGMGQTVLHASTGTAGGGPATINGYTNTAWNERIFNSQTISTLSGTAPPTFATGEASWSRLNKVNTLITDMTLLGTGPANTAATSQGPGGLMQGPGSNGFGAFERVEFKNGYAAKSNAGVQPPQGGGAVQFSSKGQFRDCAFTNNTAGTSGGAILAQGTPDFGFIEVSGSTFSGNFAGGDGSTGTNGALASAGGGAILSQAYLAVTNSTFTGNSTNGYGGAILINGTSYPTNALNGQAPLVDIRSSTIVGNNANANDDAYGLGGGIYIDSPNSLNNTIAQPMPNIDYIANSIVANNTVAGSASNVGGDCSVTPTAQGSMYVNLAISNSLIKTPGTGVCAASGNGNLTDLDPKLNALASNGGPTQTLALQANSPAIDAGNPAGCTGHFGGPLPYDQRGKGFIRSAGMGCDMGAFEWFGVAIAPGTPALTAASDSGDSNSDGITNVTTPAFTGTCGTSGDTVTVAIDGAKFTSGPCNAGTYITAAAVTLTAATHSIEAYESNSKGASPLSGSSSFTIVLAGPSITLTSTPAAWEDGSTGLDEFVFTVSGNRLSTAQCTMDGATVAGDGCNTGDAQYFGLAPGQHTFVVKATDVAGNVTTQTYAWQIGTPTGPVVVLTAASDTGVSNSDGITKADPLVFQIACVNGDSIQLFEDAAAAGAPVVCAGGSASFSLAGVTEGTHAMTAQATRATATGPVGATKSIIVDRTAPLLMMDSTPQSNMVSTSATFTFHDDDGSAMQCQLDGNAAVACTSPQTYTGLALGSHTITITSTDVAGNVATPLSYTWSVIQPLASGAPMLSPASDTGRSNSDGITNAIATVFTGACTDGDSIQLYDGGNAAGAAATCASGVYNITLSNLPEGTHSIAMTATRNGIASAMSVASTIIIDRTAPDAPAINGTAGPAGLTATLSGLAEPNAIVAVYDAGTPVCSAVADAQANWTCSGSLSGSGTRSLTATATDVAGNTGAASPAFTLTTSGNDRIFANGFDG